MVTTYSLLIVSTALYAQAPEWEEEFPGQKGSLPKSLQHSPRGLGIGIFSGSPTGPIALELSYKWKQSMQQLALGGDMPEGNFRLKFDHLWRAYVIPSHEYLYFPIFVGLGLSTKIDERYSETSILEEDYISLRVPFVMSSNNENIAIDLYAEVVPTVMVLPNLQLGFEAGIGSRIYFF